MKSEKSLREMIEDGVLKAGAKIFATYKGEEVKGVITAKGEVRIGGEKFQSVSTAAKVVQRNMGNPKPSVNGWKFFRTNKDRQPVFLADLR